MSRQQPKSKQFSTRAARIDKRWKSLTWEDVERWAGSLSLTRGEAYQRQQCVDGLVIAEDGRLLATVTGTRRYVTSVWLESSHRAGREIASLCNCPVGANGCKHAVAVVLECLDLLATNQLVPVADADDPRWSKLADVNGDTADEFEDDAEDSLEDCDEASVRKPDDSRDKRFGGKRRTRAFWDEKIKAHLHVKSQDELADLVWSLVERFPDLRREFQERSELIEGDPNRLLTLARRELRSVTEQMGWRNQWTGEDTHLTTAG
jgi:uncharacterized Zn finger protein